MYQGNRSHRDTPQWPLPWKNTYLRARASQGELAGAGLCSQGKRRSQHSSKPTGGHPGIHTIPALMDRKRKKGGKLVLVCHLLPGCA